MVVAWDENKITENHPFGPSLQKNSKTGVSLKLCTPIIRVNSFSPKELYNEREEKKRETFI